MASGVGAVFIAAFVCCCFASFDVIASCRQNLLFESEMFRAHTFVAMLLSKLCMVLTSIAMLFLVLSFYTPIISDECYCFAFLVSSILCFVAGLYCFKFAVLIHIHLTLSSLSAANQEAVDYSAAQCRRPSWWQLYLVLVIVGLIASVILVPSSFSADCEEHSKGCSISIGLPLIIVSNGCIFLDTAVVFVFIRHAIRKLKELRAPEILLLVFKMEWLFITIALVVTCITIGMENLLQKYEFFVLFAVNAVIVVVCNLIAFNPCCGRILGDTSSDGDENVDGGERKESSVDLNLTS